MPTRCDYAVVGAGIAGASAAYELAAHGEVVLIEREAVPGYHTTGRSAAQFLQSYGSLQIRRLTQAGRGFFEVPPDGFTDVPLLHPRAAVFFAREDQIAALEALHEEVSALTPAVSLLDAASARELVPVLREGYVTAAMLEPDSSDIDVGALHQSFLRGARRRGTRLLVDAEVRSIERTAHGWRLRTPAGDVVATVVVDAAGAWCDEVARLAGVAPIGLTPKRRTVLVLDAPAEYDTAAWPLAIDVDEEVYFKPESGGLLASPADETPSPPCDAQPEELDVAICVDRLQRATTLEVQRIGRRWAGLRSFVADKSLVVGMDPQADGFFWLAGQGGYGIQTAPAAARAAAGLLATGRLPGDLEAIGLEPAHLSPTRLAHVHDSSSGEK